MSNIFLLLCILAIVKLVKQFFTLHRLNGFMEIFFQKIRPVGRKMMRPRPSILLAGVLGIFLICGIPHEICAGDVTNPNGSATMSSAMVETDKPTMATTAPIPGPTTSTTPATTTETPPSHVMYTFSGDFDLAELSKLLKNVNGTADIEDSRPGFSTGGEFSQFTVIGTHIETTAGMKGNGTFTAVASLKFISKSPLTNATTTTSTPSTTTTQPTTTQSTTITTTTTTPSPVPCVLPFKYKVLIFVSMCILVIFILGLLSILYSSDSWRSEGLLTSCAIWRSNLRERCSRRRMRFTVNPLLNRFRHPDDPAAHQHYPVDEEAYEML